MDIDHAWIYKGKPLTEAPDGYFGFVYVIENLLTGKKYIGKKQFKLKRRLKPLKGKKRARIKYYESDWQSYWGSSDFLHEDIKEHGKENYRREILTLCTTKSHQTYEETRQLFINNVLYERLENGEKAYFNGNIAGKFHWRQEIEDALLEE